MSCAWLATASWSTVPRSMMSLSTSGRRKTLSRASMSTRDSERYLGVISWTTPNVTSATRIVGRRIFHFLRQSAAPSAGRSKSASTNGPLPTGRGDCDATLISPLPTNLAKQCRPITNY